MKDEALEAENRFLENRRKSIHDFGNVLIGGDSTRSLLPDHKICKSHKLSLWMSIVGQRM
jgi:hypothetical protein